MAVDRKTIELVLMISNLKQIIVIEGHFNIGWVRGTRPKTKVAPVFLKKNSLYKVRNSKNFYILCVIKLKNMTKVMKQDKKGRELFRQIVDETPKDLKKQLGYSDAIAIKLDGMLKQRGMSQRDLAKNTGKTEAEVSRWLGGTHNFTLRTLAKISIVLGEDVIIV